MTLNEKLLTREEVEKSPAQLKARIAELEKQCELPLTGHEIQLLIDVLGEQKEKLKDKSAVLAGLNLLEKLDGYIRPTLFDRNEEAEYIEDEEEDG